MMIDSLARSTKPSRCHAFSCLLTLSRVIPTIFPSSLCDRCNSRPRPSAAGSTKPLGQLQQSLCNPRLRHGETTNPRPVRSFAQAVAKNVDQHQANIGRDFRASGMKSRRCSTNSSQSVIAKASPLRGRRQALAISPTIARLDDSEDDFLPIYRNRTDSDTPRSTNIMEVPEIALRKDSSLAG